MSHLGLICLDATGHLNPMTALGRELKGRGHRVTLIGVGIGAGRPDTRAKTESAGLEYIALGERGFPVGSLVRDGAELGRLGGFRAIRVTIDLLRQGGVVVLEEAPAAITAAGIDALLVDGVMPAGNLVAEMLGLPFVTVCNTLAPMAEPAIPPMATTWRYRCGRVWRARNAFGNMILRSMAKPLRRELDVWLLARGLPPLGAGSPRRVSLAQITQQPAFFDYPREQLPKTFHYTGPWRTMASDDKVEFPWEKLDGRPLIYASMGTVQNRQVSIFETIALACAGLDAQLILALGSRDQRLELNLAGAPIVVPFAPQLELLRRAALTITHAGFNTALESLAQGVPMVAIPITNDHPGVASRLEWLGVARVVPPSRLTVRRLRAAVRAVLTEHHYRASAEKWKAEIGRLDGLKLAADIVEQAIETRQPVVRT